jgi:hypothetical protein
MTTTTNKPPLALLAPPGPRAPGAPPAWPEGFGQHGGKLLVRQDFGLWSGLLPYDLGSIPPVKEPVIRWHGAKIPSGIWSQLAAFFRHANATWKSEAQARLYYSAEKAEWKVVVAPQRVATGMFSGELKDWQMTPDQRVMRAEAFSAPGDGFLPNGTFHSHCDCSAFQSGTDHADEISQPGVHITFGKVSSERIHVHGRVSYRGIIYPIRWDDWFPGWPEGLDPALPTFEYAVGKEFKAEFPKEWLDRCFPYDSKPAAVGPRDDWWGRKSLPAGSSHLGGYGFGSFARPAPKAAKAPKAPKAKSWKPRGLGWSSKKSRKLESAVKHVYEATLSAPFAEWAQGQLELEQRTDPDSDLFESAQAYAEMGANLFDALLELRDYGVPKSAMHAMVGRWCEDLDALDPRRDEPAKAVPADAARRLPQGGFDELFENDPDSWPFHGLD